ncbi:MAG: hypothetical protein Q8M17_17135 [Actinomycetota bacterium]|nr:hypothetical protein [Actinomycetota bacterium]
MSRTTLVRSAKLAAVATAGAFVLGSVGPGSSTAAIAEVSPYATASLARAMLAVQAAARPIVVRPSAAAVRHTVQVARHTAYTRFTLRSKATRDMRGVERSLYRGRFYRPATESLRRCIADRESEGHYDVVSPSGSYFGAYQVSRDLARGATWMMLKEHKRLMGARAAKRVLADLRAKPMNRWPRYWQDAAFFTVLNWEGPRSGAAHWAGGRWRC